MANESWHEWRSKGLGSSDAPIIMGVSPWSTPYELWEQKTKRVVKSFSNWATDRGNRLEPVARARYELETSLESPATLVVNPDYPYVRASLDGFNNLHGVILEIKCPGRADHETALEGKVPEKYYPQIQHQFLACPAAKVAHYYSFDGERGVLVEVQPNKEYMATLFKAETKFWGCILNDTPPGFTVGDFKRVRCKELEELLDEYEVIRAKILLHDKLKDKVRAVVSDKWRIHVSENRIESP